MKHFLFHRWFLIALVLVLLGGMYWAPSLQPLGQAQLPRHATVAVVLFLMALPLQAQTVWRTMRRPAPPLLAVAINFGLLPLFAWGVSFGLSPAMAGGLLVAATTPSTLASAAVWTRRAGGNDSVAILVTILTNTSCFLITPLWLFLMVGQQVDLAMTEMIGKLAVLVVLPMIAAQLLRLSPPVGHWATAHKVPLGVLAQCGILLMILIGAINTGLKLTDSQQPTPLVVDFLLMAGAVLLVHLSMLWVGLQLARLFGFSREDCIAVGFAGSQKTLMVGLHVALACQLSILPMVTYHVGQLFVDTLIADRFRRDAGGG